MDEIQYIIGQALGALAIALGFISFQMRTQNKLLLLQSLTCVAFCFHYLLIGAITGLALNIVNLIRNLVYFERNRRKGTGKLIPIVFTVLLGVIGIVTWEAWYSVFALLGMLIHTLCMAMSDAKKVKLSILVTSPLVLLYDVFVHSYGGIVYESVAIVSAVIGVLRSGKGSARDADA